MSQLEWYCARDNKQTGPIPPEELKRLATVGEIRPEDLVWHEGMIEWSLARNVRGLFEASEKLSESGVKIAEPIAASAASPAVASSASTVAQSPVARSPVAQQASRRHVFDLLLDSLRASLTPSFVESTTKMFRACGSYGLLASMLLAVVFTTIMAVKSSPGESLLWGANCLLLLAVLHYVAGRFCDALERLGDDLSAGLASSAVPDSVALASLIAGAAAILASVVWTIATPFYPAILLGLLMFLVFGYLAAVALNPTMLGISINAKTRSSDEAIGVVAFLLKMLLRLAPVAFGGGVVYGAMLLAYACGQTFSAGDSALKLAEGTAAVARNSLWVAGVLPVAAYVLFLVCRLALDVCLALLNRPTKLDS